MNPEWKVSISSRKRKKKKETGVSESWTTITEWRNTFEQIVNMVSDTGDQIKGGRRVWDANGSFSQKRKKNEDKFGITSAHRTSLPQNEK